MQVLFHQENKTKPVMVTVSVKGKPDLTKTRKATEADAKTWDKAWAEFEARK